MSQNKKSKPRPKPKPKAKKKNVGKTILIIFISLLILGMAVIDGWWLYIYFYGPDKVVSNTFEIGMQELQSGEARPFLEIAYYSNKNKNGVEMFDMKYNYLLDENRENFYSQGLQFVADTPNNELEWAYAVNQDSEYRAYHEGGWYDAVTRFDYSGWWTAGNGSSSYNYASGDNFATDTHLSTNILTLDSSFKLTLNEDIFLMKFKNIVGQMLKIKIFGLEGEELQTYEYYAENAVKNDQNFVRQSYVYEHHGIYGVNIYRNYYSYFDSNWLAHLLFQMAEKQSATSTKQIVLEFGDVFNYYKYDAENQVYNEVAVENEDRVKVLRDVKSYYCVSIKISDDGAQRASDSLFNCIHGNSNFNLTGDYDSDQYFIGRTVKTVTLSDFELVETADPTKFKLKLTQAFIDYWDEYRSDIVLDVNIDQSKFTEKGITFDGFTEDAFANFQVWRTNAGGDV